MVSHVGIRCASALTFSCGRLRDAALRRPLHGGCGSFPASREAVAMEQAWQDAEAFAP